jgi:hypothetical protein
MNDVIGNRPTILILSQEMVVKTSLPDASSLAVLPRHPSRAALYFPDKFDDPFRLGSAQQ